MLDLSILPSMTSAEAAFMTHAVSITDVGSIALGGEECLLRVASDIDPPADASILSVGARSELGSFALHLDVPLVDDISDTLLPGWTEQSPEVLPPEWRAIAAAHQVLMQTPLSHLDWSFDWPIAEVEIRRNRQLHLQVAWRQQVHSVVAEVVEDVDPMLLQELMPLSRQGQLSVFSIPVPLNLSLPTIPTTIGRAQSIGPGDVLLPPGSAGSTIPVRIQAVGGLCFTAQLSSSGSVSIQSVVREDLNMKAPYEATDVAPDQPTDTETEAHLPTEDLPIVEDPQLGELPVRIDVSLPHIAVPLSEFASLRPGAVLDLASDLTAPVRITANGRTVGSGQLIQLEDRIGVQIQTWHQTPEQSDG